MEYRLLLRQGFDAANERQGNALVCPYQRGDKKEAIWMMAFAEKSSFPDLTLDTLYKRYRDNHLTERKL